GFERGILRLDHCRTCNLGQERRRLWRLQRFQGAPEQIWLPRSLDQDAAKSLAKSRQGCKHTQRPRLDCSCLAVEVIAQDRAQAADALAIERFEEYALRIKPRDENLAAYIVRDIAGGDANGAVGPVCCR